MSALETLILTFGPMTVLGLWELREPRYRPRFPVLRRRAGNIGIWLFNTTLAAVVFTSPDLLRAPWALPLWSSWILGFLAIDLMAYANHRIIHAVPLLWRLHSLHHSDPDPDWSTSVRHHPGEYLLLGGVYWVVILFTGIPGSAVAGHALVQFVTSLACHSNVRWPARVERLLRPVMITLDIHLVHHSGDPAHANANFGVCLSIWDRLFGTLVEVPRQTIAGLTFGVREIDPRHACRPTGMLRTPWQIKS